MPEEPHMLEGRKEQTDDDDAEQILQNRRDP